MMLETMSTKTKQVHGNHWRVRTLRETERILKEILINFPFRTLLRFFLNLPRIMRLIHFKSQILRKSMKNNLPSNK